MKTKDKEQTEKPQTNDEKIKHLIKEINALIEQQELKPDWRGNWFSNNQLDALRQIYERDGMEASKLFQIGRIDRRGNRFERKKNEILLGVLELIEELDLSRKIASYTLGKLNPILDRTRKGEDHASD